jgi:predicted aspartyl protease
MKTFLAIALLAVSVPACAQPEPAPAYDPTKSGTVAHALCLLGYTGVPLRQLATGHHVVDVTLNGRRAAFVLDTGANGTVIDSALAARFGANGRPVASGPAVGIGGSRQAVQVRIESFTIGGMPTRQRTIMVSDLSGFTGVMEQMGGERVQGIVGQDLMREHRAVVDVKGRVAYFIQADREPAPVDAARCRARR